MVAEPLGLAREGDGFQDRIARPRTREDGRLIEDADGDGQGPTA